jgi:RNA polymerase sigma-70 factor (ECF subfamily)
MELMRDINEYREMVFRIAYGYVKSTHDADDIAQEVFLKLYKNKRAFTDEEGKKAWLIRVTMNQAKSLLSSVWRRRVTELTEAELSSLSRDSLELYDFVEALPPKYRTVIYLFYYEEYSVKEIAEILKIRESTVTTQLNRARGQLKTTLLKEGFVL